MQQLPPLPALGATVIPGGGVRFRVWAPRARRIELLLTGGAFFEPVRLEREAGGYHTAVVPQAATGDRYRFLVDGAGPFPDPCSRWQPEGPHESSAVDDPSAFPWTDGGRPGLIRERLVIYELHVGTFTAEGTFAAIIPELPRLKDLGVTAIELMPVAEFPGTRNWGYDGVDLFAPSHVYGGPEGLRRLVDAAHAAGLGVLLDAVYNHLGPDGNYLGVYSPYYLTDRYTTPWGDALNFDGPHSRPVRDFVCASACHWIRDYHLDGLRLDAVHAIHDASPLHILAELTARARHAADRSIVVIAESDANDVRLIRPPPSPTPRPAGAAPHRFAQPPPPPEAVGLGLDSVWADDFHHAVRVHLTGEREGYYAGFTGSTAEIARAIAEGFIYQGQVAPAGGAPRGTRVTDEPAAAFVFCIQNHDQVGNRAEGERLSVLVDRDRYAAATALLLLAPETPLLFMGQEYGATTPFLYFTGHHEELGRLVTAGRREEFAGFPAFRDPARRARIPDPQDESTFLRSKLDPAERVQGAPMERLHHDLLALRRHDPVLRVQNRAATHAGAPTDQVVSIHRWHEGRHRLLLVNFGDEATLAWKEAGGEVEPANAWWLLWWSGDTAYGDSRTPPALTSESIVAPSRCAMLLARDAGS